MGATFGAATDRARTFLGRVPTIRPVTSLDDPALAPFRSLRRPDDVARAATFVAEGPKVIARLLASPLTVESMLCTARWLEHFRATLETRAPSATVFLAEENELRRLVGFNLFNGVLASARVPVRRSVQEILAARPAPAWWLALDGLTSAENLGTIVRSAVAFGAGAILCGETGAPPWLRRAVRVSMGAMFTVPVVETDDLAADLRRLAAAGVPSLALEAEGGRPLASLDLRGPLCLVLGSEGTGARPAVHAVCSVRATIPMPGATDSLNVAAAAAVAGYEIARQRTAASG